jgi:hypothetical protein
MNVGPFTEQVLQRLRERNLALPIPSPPAGAYEPFRLDRGTGYLAAQLPSRDGKYVLLGRVGEPVAWVACPPTHPRDGHRRTPIRAVPGWWPLA